MLDTADQMDYFGGFGSIGQHAKELAGAAVIAQGWADGIREDWPAEDESAPEQPTDLSALQAAGTHPAPCARSCEANAYDLEIRRLNAEISSLRNAIANEHRQGALSAQSQAILICARIEDEQEGASGGIWARTIRTEIERMLD
jgi:hypothetical protein